MVRTSLDRGADVVAAKLATERTSKAQATNQAVFIRISPFYNLHVFTT
jgi:hypothetical protein